MIGIVGYTGFVGLNLQQFYYFDKFYNSKNFNEASNKHFNTLFFCGIPAVKWYANKNPDEDTETIENIKKILNTITCDKFILISTIDVYENTCNEFKTMNEDYICDYNNNHTYGKNRYLFENYIINKFNNYHIIRLPALFGKGLKKNIIYDLINDNQINNIPINSYFQWYNLDRLKKDIDIIIKNNIKICNLVTEPISTLQIINLFDKIYNTNYSFTIEYLNNNANIIKYNIFTKHHILFNNDNNYITDEENVLNDIGKFLEFTKLNKSKLCVSNICVNKIHQLQFACILKLFGINNIQIAPTKFISWNNLDNLDLSFYKEININVYSYQSILYTLDNLNIFNDTQNELYEHFKKVIDNAVKNNIKILVFGCPKNRNIINEKLDNENVFINFFKKIGDYCNDKNITICIENNSKKYNCNFLNKINECFNIVNKINHPKIKMMVDLGNAVMENDNWYYLYKYIDLIHNIDISHENMKDFSKVDESNYIFNFVLNRYKYNNIINLEMIINNDNELEILCDSLNNFINIYSSMIET
jgi:sugar phosphate isomerase/epimerase